MNPILENTPEQMSIEETPTMEPTPLTETLAEHIAQAVAQAVAPLQKQIDRYQSQQLQQTRTLALKDALTLCQDPTFTQQTLKDFALMQFPSQEDFEHFLREKQADILLANQALSHRELASETPPYSHTRTTLPSPRKWPYTYKPKNNPKSSPAKNSSKNTSLPLTIYFLAF